MKTKTRKYKTKHRKTRRGGAPIIPAKVAPATAPVASAPVEVKKNAPVEPPKSSWFSFFGPASKPGDKIVEAAKKLEQLLKEKNISTDLKLEQIKSEAAKLA
jgi:hypothetical protein